MNKLFAPSLAIAAGALGVMLCAQASANEYSALLKTYKYAEVERAANAKLAQDAGNAEALVAKSEAILAGGVEDRVEEAVKLSERCVAAHPQVAGCHLALGKALGTKALMGGIMSAMGYVGTIRDAFKKAVELDPQNMDARFALLQYYMQAPSIAGGGSGKAQALAAQTATLNGDAGKLMMARLDTSDDRMAHSEALVMAMATSTNEAVADAQRDLMNNIGNSYLTDKKLGDSERIYREAIRRFPDSYGALYGLARVQQEQGKHREAIAGMEQAIAMVARAGAWYRIGKSQQALGDKAKAAAAYDKALSFKPALPKNLKSDAEDQLKAVKK